MGNYWWSRYGNFAPGVGAYPHMGQVIAHYRVKRGFRRQEDLAIALNYSKRQIEEWEGTSNMKSPESVERRQLLGRLLRIPPALLALDWHYLYSGSHVQQDEVITNQLQQSDVIFKPYQDILHMARGYLYNGGPGYIVTIVDDSLAEISPLAKTMPVFEKEPWLEMLCRYYQLSTSFALRHLDKEKALYYARKAIEIAAELEHIPLLASAHYRRTRVHLDLTKYTTDAREKQERLIDAKADVQACLNAVDDVGPILKGNIYLIASEVYALGATDEQTQKKCKEWQTKAESITYKTDDSEEDDTFLRLNATALHHEKAKTKLLFGDLKAAHTELTTARKTLNADLLTWHANLHITEARLFLAEGDLEASVSLALDAHHITKVVQSHKEAEEIKGIGRQLLAIDPTNPHVCRLGLTVGAL